MTAVRRWPLALIASPAAVAIWSGWVGLGGMCGFGPIHPLPGIAGGVVINTAITLPVGVEAYGAYALRAWLTPGVPERAQRFARRSAIGALALGMCGQVIYHLLSAAHATRAPWPVVMLVSCIPVITLGFGAALTHLLREPVPGSSPLAAIAVPEPEPEPVPELPAVIKPAVVPGRPAGDIPEPVAVPVSEPSPVPVPKPAPEPAPELAGHLNGHAHQAAEVFAADLAAGRVPGIRAIRTRLHVGQDKATQVQAYLRAVAAGA
jgi:hypothetical protein